jgi:predicted porin
MKRKLLPLLIAGITVAAAGTATAGAPTVYGKINVTLQQFDLEQINGAGAVVEERDDWQMRSNASRLGVKGDFDITESLKAIYKLEYEVSVDTGTNSNGREFSARNIVGGFQGGWGTLVAGRHDTPLKLIQEKVDRFNDLQVGDISNYMVGEFRRDNIVMYTTPTLGGFAFTAAFAPGEGATGPDGKTDDSIADTTSFALSYGAGSNLYLAVAHEQNMAGNSSAGSSDITRLVGEAVLGPVKLGALYQMAEQHDSQDVLAGVPGAINQFGGNFEEQDAWIVSGEWAATKEFVLKAQYGYSESTPFAAGVDDAEATLIAVGADYKLDKNSKLFAYYAQLEVEGDSLFSSSTPSDKTFGIGYELNF